MDIKGVIESQILNCFSPKVSFNDKPRVVKEELGKKMEEEKKVDNKVEIVEVKPNRK